jgi:glutathione S-transferase
MSVAEHRSADYKKLNPVGKVPVLVDGDVSVWDSHAISIYLVEKFATNDDLYPKNFATRTLVNQILFFDASFLFQRLYEILIPIYFGLSKEVPSNKKAEVHEAYEIIENFLATGNRFLCGDSITIADISIISTLLSLRLLIPIDNEKYSRLGMWVSVMEKRSSYNENQKGADDHLKFITRCLEGRPIVSRLPTAPKSN